MPTYTPMVALEVNTFHTIELEEAKGLFNTRTISPGYLLPTRPLPVDVALHFHEVVGSRMQNLPIQVYRAVDEDGQDLDSAFLITSRFNIDNFHTGLVQVFKSWQGNIDNPAVSSSELFLALKMHGLYIYSATNKVTVVTIPDLHEKLEDLLLAI